MRWFIWRRGLSGPSPAILTERSIDEHDRRTKLGEPIKLPPDEEDWPFAKLVEKYPAPKVDDK